MSEAGPEAQVRRCARCAKPAGVMVEGFAFGHHTPWYPGQEAPPGRIVSGTFRCQSCGAAVRWQRFGVVRILGLLVLVPGLLFMGLGVLLFAGQTILGASEGDPVTSLVCVVLAFLGQAFAVWQLVRPWWSARRWPVVHAPRPAVSLGPPSHTARVCGCGGVAPVARVVPLRLRGILPIGSVHEHACPECKATFNVHDLWAVVLSAFAAVFLSSIGALVTAFPPGSAVGATSSNRWVGIVVLTIGLLALILPVTRTVGRRRHPPVRPKGF